MAALTEYGVGRSCSGFTFGESFLSRRALSQPFAWSHSHARSVIPAPWTSAAPSRPT